MKKITVILVAILFFSSCEKIIFEEKKESTNPKENFEYLWKQCDEKYSYFDVKNINWDNIHAKYNAKIYDGMSEDSLFKVLGAMLNELRDDHTNLISSFNISQFGVYHYGQDNFDWRIVKDNYLPKDLYNSGPFSHEFLIGQNNEIGYIRFSEFTGTVNDVNLDFILNRYKNTKGLILDLRENGGGAVTDVFQILSRFVETETTVYYSRYKTGPKHNEFSDPEPSIVKPYDGIRYTNKVAVLIDRGTFSAGSFTSLATKAIPNLILIGDTTGGGLGLPNGGQLPNAWTYRFSTTQTLTLDKKPDFEQGVPPDVVALFDWNNLSTDEVIETAITELQ
jgi:C-terminal processing protease CtpA/Prc